MPRRTYSTRVVCKHKNHHTDVSVWSTATYKTRRRRQETSALEPLHGASSTTSPAPGFRQPLFISDHLVQALPTSSETIDRKVLYIGDHRGIRTHEYQHMKAETYQCKPVVVGLRRSSLSSKKYRTLWYISGEQQHNTWFQEKNRAVEVHGTPIHDDSIASFLLSQLLACAVTFQQNRISMMYECVCCRPSPVCAVLNCFDNACHDNRGYILAKSLLNDGRLPNPIPSDCDSCSSL